MNPVYYRCLWEVQIESEIWYCNCSSPARPKAKLFHE